MSFRILLVEDHEPNRYLATFLLEKAGHRVVSCADGMSALQRVKDGAWDLILLDIQLPGMDGFEVVRELRRRPALSRVPIVAVTSHAMTGDRERALEAGFTDTIEKPIDPYSFTEIVGRYLQR